jgi:hypothetical protein
MCRQILATGLALTLGCGSSAIPGGPTQAGLPDARCGPTTLSFVLGAVDGASLDWGRQPIVAQGLVYLHRRATFQSNANTDLEVFALEPQTGVETQVTANDVDEWLLDANDGALLLVRRRDTSGGWELLYRDAVREVSLDATTSSPGPGVDYGWDGQPVRLVRRDRAAWRTQDTVYYYDGYRVTSISSGLHGNNAPYLEGNTVVWAASGGGGREIYQHTPDGTRRITNNSVDDWAPVASASRVFWLSGRAVHLREDRTGEVRVLAEGPCSPPAAYQGMAVFACDGPPQAVEPGLLGRRLWFFDGSSLREVPTLGGLVYSPRLCGRRIAWIEYMNADSLCYPPREPSGTVVFWSGEEGSAPQALGRVGSPCMCCNAIWPPAYLGLECDLLAWNYAQSSEPERGAGIGYAVVHEQRECTPAL